MPALLALGNDTKRFDQEKAATIKGFVINVKEGGKESCNCEASKPDDIDTHIELGLAADAPETQRVIVEVTPRLRILKKKAGIFFFQAEDGIRDYKVTGVQTCALPI